MYKLLTQRRPATTKEMVSGIVVEYGTHKPIEGVQFVHADCKKWPAVTAMIGSIHPRND
jgi:hypothetical protein